MAQSQTAEKEPKRSHRHEKESPSTTQLPIELKHYVNILVLATVSSSISRDVPTGANPPAPEL